MRVVSLPALLVALLVACGGGGGTTDPDDDNTPGNPSNPSNPSTPNNPGTPAPPPSSQSVNVSDNSFSPDSVEVAIGGTVTWSWTAAYSAHNVTFSGGETSGNQTSGEYSRIFSSAGNFTYNCTIHGAAMKGVVRVR